MLFLGFLAACGLMLGVSRMLPDEAKSNEQDVIVIQVEVDNQLYSGVIRPKGLQHPPVVDRD